MAEDHISYLSFMASASLSAILLPVCFYLWHHKTIPLSFSLAAACSLIWSMGLAQHYQPWQQAGLKIVDYPILSLEILRYGSWIMALLHCLHSNMSQPIPKRIIIVVAAGWLLWLGFSPLYSAESIAMSAADAKLLAWNNCLFAMLGIVVCEQLFKNAQHIRLAKLWSTCTAAILLYDLFLFSYYLILEQQATTLLQARGIVNASTILIMISGSLILARQKTQRRRLAPSRQIAFYTTTLTAAIIFVGFIGAASYYIEKHGGQWGNTIQTTLLFIALITMVIVLSSETIQSWLRVWINKHFFRHKYDYRNQWLNLINALSRQAPEDNFQQHALKVMADIFHCQGAGLWLKQGQRYMPAAELGQLLPQKNNKNCQQACDSPLCKRMEDLEWVYAPDGSTNNADNNTSSLMPEWMKDIPDLWLIVPLLTETEMLGFIILSSKADDKSVSWEDLDLIKTVGRQLASYLDRHQAAEQLASTQQFEAFNKLTAFIMHDLKNLIAQQALVVENAAKHKDNPAFVEDAIKTIDNSVTRMSDLLKKLQPNQVSSLRILNLQALMRETITRCQDNKPAPTLTIPTEEIAVNADQQKLAMCILHIIKNAQEATQSNGFVDVTLKRCGNDATILVEDNGEGMSKEFIINKLFRPFSTTKSGKGMGIGVYQAKEYLEALGGSISVESGLGKGTSFEINIPTVRK